MDGLGLPRVYPATIIREQRRPPLWIVRGEGKDAGNVWVARASDSLGAIAEVLRQEPDFEIGEVVRFVIGNGG